MDPAGRHVSRFANLADAGAQLAVRVRDARIDDPLVLAVIPNGVPVALPVASALGVRAIGLPVDRRDEPVVHEVPDVRGRRVIVVDDGVETGRVARAVQSALRPAGPAELLLAVPVCSREAMAALDYDRIIAVETPFGRRSLAWHFDDFDVIDDARAQALLAGS